MSPEARSGAEARPGTTAAPPSALDPVMAFIERVDRRRRRIRSIQTGAVLGLEMGRHRGPPVVLRDGTEVRSGSRIGLVHFDNQRVRALTKEGSLTPAWIQGRADLRALAAWARARPETSRPVAYFGEGLHAAAAARVGFEVRPRPRTWFRRLQDWYFRGLMARWSNLGRERLAIGRHELHAAEYWLSAGRLERLYGTAAGTAREDRPAG